MEGNDMASPLVKGFLIGSSLGILAAVFGITDSLPRSILLGSFGGIFAGMTMNYKIKRQQDKDGKK
jgi:hypothetical protein